MKPNISHLFFLAVFSMWCPFLSHIFASFPNSLYYEKVDTHTFVSVYFHFTGAVPKHNGAAVFMTVAQKKQEPAVEFSQLFKPLPHNFHNWGL